MARPIHLDETSAAWLRALGAGPATRHAAVSDLHGMLVRAARAELRRRPSRIVGAELDDVAHQCADDALLAILAKLDTFRGDSRFATWAYRFVILEVATKHARHFWHKPRVALDEHQWEQLPSRAELDPQRRAEWNDLVAALRDAVADELTPHQRLVFSAIALREIPLDTVVAELGSSRNAVSKTMFDARRTLRRALAKHGKEWLSSAS